MCCLVAVLLVFGPRAGILVWWLIDQPRWLQAFDGFLLPFLGFLFAPWTTLVYVLVSPGGIIGFDWVWMALGILGDLAGYSGGYRNRRRVVRPGAH